jgi:hypothetical protein
MYLVEVDLGSEIRFRLTVCAIAKQYVPSAVNLVYPGCPFRYLTFNGEPCESDWIVATVVQ